MSSIAQANAITLSSRVTNSKGHIVADLGGELAILNLKTGVYYGLNEVGARIWELLKENPKMSEIRDAITREYQVDVSRCEQDVLALLLELASYELIEWSHDPAFEV